MVIGRRKSPVHSQVVVPAASGALQSGLSCLRACRYKEAARELRHAVDDDPESGTVRGYLATALLYLKDFAGAVAEVDRAIILAPHDGPLHLLRARSLDELGRTVDAAEACRAAVLYDPENKEAHLTLNAVALKLGDTRSAEVALENAAAIDPFDCGVLLDLATVRERRGNLRGAIEAVQWSISLNPRRPDEYIRLCNLLDLNGDLDGAIEAMQSAYDLTPREPSNLYVLARLLLRQRKYGEVLARYEKAIKTDGGNRDRYTADLTELSGTFLLAEEELRVHNASADAPELRPTLEIVRDMPTRDPGYRAETIGTARDPDSIDYLEDSVSADPTNSKLRRTLSIRYLQAGRLIEARREAEMAERLSARRGAAV